MCHARKRNNCNLSRATVHGDNRTRCSNRCDSRPTERTDGVLTFCKQTGKVGRLAGQFVRCNTCAKLMRRRQRLPCLHFSFSALRHQSFELRGTRRKHYQPSHTSLPLEYKDCRHSASAEHTRTLSLDHNRFVRSYALANLEELPRRPYQRLSIATTNANKNKAASITIVPTARSLVEFYNRQSRFSSPDHDNGGKGHRHALWDEPFWARRQGQGRQGSRWQGGE